MLSTISEYQELVSRELSEEEVRLLCRTDLYFLLRYVSGRKDVENQWILDRCREVQESPNGHLDLWSREHYKSTVITFAKSIQDILASHGEDQIKEWGGREVTIGIFSHTRPIAKKFLRQIKIELEGNDRLKALFPDILFPNPHKDAPRWSEDSGIVVKRKTNPKEATVEAWGLVDAMPTGAHFLVRVYDDVVVDKSVTSPEMIAKTTSAWEVSLNLGMQDGGVERYIGTRWHANDTYREILRRKAAEPRLHPATEDGELNGKPVMWPKQFLEKRIREMGPYTAACHGAGTKVLMADWTERNIEDIREGAIVVGFDIGGEGKRTALKPVKVIAIQERDCSPLKTVRWELESGATGVCTHDHKWFTGRASNDGHKVYGELGFGRFQIGHLTRIIPNIQSPTQEQLLAAKYMAGIYDGEGSCPTSGSMVIHQSHEHNPEVCARIEECLDILNMPYSKYIRSASKGHKASTHYRIIGGRKEKYKLLLWGNPAKRAQIVRSMFGAKALCGTSKSGSRDRLVKLEPAYVSRVYNIQTETGNYIANGYASKNCQLMQNPLADKVKTLDRNWLRYYPKGDSEVGESGMNKYLLVDPANEKNKKSDYTAMAVIGLGEDHNYYILDMIRDRLNLYERTEALFYLHKRWRPLVTAYEKYGKDSDIQHIEYVQQIKNYRFDILPVGGRLSKSDRIERLIPILANHRLYLPESIHKPDYEGRMIDLVAAFVEDEYLCWPVPVHDDMLDCIARICDEDLKVEWPDLVTDKPERESRYAAKPYRSRSGSWMSL